MKITINRGTDQIGGCVTEYEYNGWRLFVDYGEQVPGAQKTDPLEIEGLTKGDLSKSALLITHYHGDHIGRFMEIPDDVDLYMGEVTYKVMLNIRRALKDKTAVAKLKDRKDKGSIHFVEPDVSNPINDDIVVTGYSVDHSAFDAFMYLIEADGTNILHTGDFRDHGHRGHKIKNGNDKNVLLTVIKHYILKDGKRKVDVLITEGTMMGERAKEKRFSEKDLQDWATKYFKEHKYIFLKISST